MPHFAYGIYVWFLHVYRKSKQHQMPFEFIHKQRAGCIHKYPKTEEQNSIGSLQSSESSKVQKAPRR